MKDNAGAGPLAGLKIIELGGIGPGPFCAMLLADMGADVLRLDRIVPSDSGVHMDHRFNLLNRGRRSVAIDLKRPQAVELVKRLTASADAALEGFRPGVAERLGLGPDDLLAHNPRLVYGRMTGWGQDGPLAQAPGHDMNYISLSGALHTIGERDGPPVPPLNLVGDFGGGAMYLAFGMVCAMLEAARSGTGQVVDASMVDGSAHLMTLIYGMYAAGAWSDRRGDNRLDSGTPWYSVYRTRDDRYVSLASNEPRFYRETLALLGLSDTPLPDQHDRHGWPVLREHFTRVFATKTRDEWCALAAGTDVCLAPVLSLAEAPHHPHNVARGTFVEVDGIVQPGPAPRFSRTKPTLRGGAPAPGAHTTDALRDWGIDAREVDALRAEGVLQ
ncbi:CaiB/BaiF CoA transferase family protein [Burkholderia lata]|uniref:L-carnitine dehydratase/bile acid-inducible protein F n=1 Tax=Burkholderia lata (strain ATCC 17760 / DSM 23089 / LMG 22485 / NCIMB 9086 / R18194 / 383) TaxID=482957 RepID=Q39MW4_BURL3|nr:CaiB/BaiF CoA-transferase family protein [Burkholderia lata]ABB06202.1 L-carnitine dehydratase/bile acid-inducible protein F [Burkholderia lata]